MFLSPLNRSGTPLLVALDTVTFTFSPVAPTIRTGVPMANTPPLVFLTFLITFSANPPNSKIASLVFKGVIILVSSVPASASEVVAIWSSMTSKILVSKLSMVIFI